MSKSKSGYKRSFAYHAPEGAKIDINTQEVYEKLVEVSKANRWTIGQWAESNLRYALSGQPYIPPVRRSPAATPVKKPRSFSVSQELYDQVAVKTGEDDARKWIARTLLSLADLELERLRGRQVERDWSEKYRI